MRKTILGAENSAPQTGPSAVTTFAGANSLLTPIEEGFVAKPGRKTTQTESDG